MREWVVFVVVLFLGFCLCGIVVMIVFVDCVELVLHGFYIFDGIFLFVLFVVVRSLWFVHVIVFYLVFVYGVVVCFSILLVYVWVFFFIFGVFFGVLWVSIVIVVILLLILSLLF